MNGNDFFLQPIKNLPVSADFKKTAASLKFQTLNDLMQVDSAELIRMPGVTYHMMQEFIQLLEDNGQAHLLRE